ncbi:DNA phosphorothioation-dependent restriction protein DptF [Paenibacillus ehimensis]|uniref:DNA phosphorothioation-dependent restriction protein DptF n=1 Tax=Paenibacillus ehimensis TaxID=79264 RepID=UPI000FD8BC85|nr:DNA phosphorothioation-dependent restriction protein DptF [Paenibacillus ehimensis]
MSRQVHSNCLVSILKKCKQSSKEAVDNLESFDSFKQYMHIPRPVESELEKIILKSRQSERSQLILVCGGVGDGKSHTLSFLKNKYTFLSSEFYLHNDATESFDPQKTSIETLAECFDHFSDEGLESNNEVKKAILAINLGALNNFIDSEQGKRFSRLNKYVESKKILESSNVSSEYDPNSNFQFVNFSDYHMFELTENGTKSDYLSGLINKLTSPEVDNPFFKSYEENCLKNCPVSRQCPIKQNYELLSRTDIKKKIVDLIIKAIVREKIIVSTRAFLDFLYGIIVSPTYETLSDESIKAKIEQIHFDEYTENLLPYLVFSQPDSSYIQNTLVKLSPSLLRSELIDQVLIDFKTVQSKMEVFSRYINIDALPYFQEKIDELQKIEQSKPELNVHLGKIFILLSYFMSKNEWDFYEDPIFDDFIQYLYWSNQGNISQLAKLYNTEMREAIYKWDGGGYGNLISINIGQPQNHFKTLQKLEIEPYLIKSVTEQHKKELSKFLLNISISFKVKNSDNYAQVDLDYALYDLISRIRQGYRPNKNDKLQFIKFVDFINKLGCLGNQLEEIFVEEIHSLNREKYVLNYDKFFEKYKFTVV